MTSATAAAVVDPDKSTDSGGPPGGCDPRESSPRAGAGRSGSPDREEPPVERGLRGLVGGGSSQVTVTAALRARDAARPTAADLAAAQAELVIVRRGWVPRDELPRPGRRR